MGYADVLHPMIVSVRKSATFSVDNYLRRMLIVSAGGTKLAVGEYKQIDSTTYGEYVTTNSEVEKQCITFFSYAGSKNCVLLEVGTELESGVNTLKGFLTGEELKVFNTLVPSSWYYVKQPDITYTATMMPAVALKPTADFQVLPLIFGNITEITIEVPSTLDIDYTDINNIKYKLKNGTALTATAEAPLKFTVEGTLYKYTLKFNKEGGNETCYIDFNKTVNGKTDESFLKLLTEYDSIDKENLFFVMLPQLVDPSADTNYEKFKGMKSLHLVSDNSTKTTIDSAAAVVGITASNIFDISTATPASSLNYKQVKSYSPMTRSRSYKNTLIQSAITLIDELAGNSVLLNGRQLDGQPWDYYYYWYLTKFRVDEKITTLLLNGSNNPVAAVGFDQNGIDTIHANIVSTLSELQGLGVITTFAQSYDSGTGEFTGEGDIVCPNYYEYIASNPDDYANEILTGVSCYIQIGKFIRQVQWNVTLGA